MIVYRIHKNDQKVSKPGSKPEYIIQDSKGAIVTDKKILEYIEALVIPPAYRNVKIFIEKSPKILYEGFDSKDRKQQIYSPGWVKKAEKKKFKALEKFGIMMPKIHKDIKELIKGAEPTKEKMVALIIRIITVCYFRIGNMKYHKLYGSHGVSNLQKKHLTFRGKTIEINFIGKKGMLNECTITDPTLVDELRKLYNAKRGPNDFIFACPGQPTTTACEEVVSALDVNDWLKNYDPSFTTKMFRTFDTNTLLIEYIRRHHSGNLPLPSKVTETARKKIVIAAMKEISKCVNNTAAICRKSYANTDLIEMYLKHPAKFEKQFFSGLTEQAAFIQFLQKNYSE